MTHRTTVPDTIGHVRSTRPDGTGQTDKTCNVCPSGRQVSGPGHDLSGYAQALTYDYQARSGRLTLPAGCCVDMGACLRLFLAIDPAVVRVATFAGQVPDTVYTRHTAGWSAHLPQVPA